MSSIAKIWDSAERYGTVTRILHWGMAVLFLAQFVSAFARWALPREDAVRQTLWSYHHDLGITLFVLVLVRGLWGVLNLSSRPPHSGFLGRAAVAGHGAIYGLMVIVPAVRILAGWGSDRDFSYLGMTVFAAQQPEIAWTQVPVEWHGEMGWILGALVMGHIAMATVWHQLIQRDGTLQRMAG